MIKKNIFIKTSILAVIMFGLLGCTSTTLSSNTSLIQKQKEKYCFVGKHKIKDVLKKISKLSLIDYEIEEHNYLASKIINFKEKSCFSTIRELKWYLEEKNNLTLRVSNTRSANGILVKNIHIDDVIKYLNSLNNKKYIIFIDDNIKLKDSLITINTIGKLEKYILHTTPFFLERVTSNKKNDVYKLTYKELPKMDSSVKMMISYLKSSKAILAQNGFNGKEIQIRKIVKLVNELTDYEIEN